MDTRLAENENSCFVRGVATAKTDDICYGVEKMGTLHDTKQPGRLILWDLWANILLGLGRLTAAWGPPKGKPQWGVGGGAMLENVRADIAMAREENVGSDRDRRFRVFFQPGTIAVLSYRFCHLMRSIRLPVVRHLAWMPVLLVRGLSQLLPGVHLSSKAAIGPGFVFHPVYAIFFSPPKYRPNRSA